MKKIIIILCIIIVVMFTSCSKTKEYEDVKIRDLEFTVVDEQDIPELIAQKIEEKKMEEFKFSFNDGEYLYIVRGYGEQPTGGYSIQVKEVYEGVYDSEQFVVILTELLGPSKDDTVTMSLSYPYIVVKTEDLGKPVYYK